MKDDYTIHYPTHIHFRGNLKSIRHYCRCYELYEQKIHETFVGKNTEWCELRCASPTFEHVFSHERFSKNATPGSHVAPFPITRHIFYRPQPEKALGTRLIPPQVPSPFCSDTVGELGQDYGEESGKDFARGSHVHLEATDDDEPTFSFQTVPLVVVIDAAEAGHSSQPARCSFMVARHWGLA